MSITLWLPSAAIVPDVAPQARRWLAYRGGIARSRESRQFADDILDELAANRYGPSAWATFIGRSLVRSVAQARMRLKPRLR